MPKSTDPLARDAARDAAMAAAPQGGRTARRGEAAPRDAGSRDAGPSEFGETHQELRPIGPERLKRLRESIRNGTYPLEERARSGLLRMFLGHPTPRSETEESD